MRDFQRLNQQKKAHANFGFQLIALTSTFTSGARSSLVSESTVSGVAATMSSIRVWIRISNCSRESLLMCGERSTVYFLMCVGSGTGPRMSAPVRLTASTMLPTVRSSTLWSYALSLSLILSISYPLKELLEREFTGLGCKFQAKFRK